MIHILRYITSGGCPGGVLGGDGCLLLHTCIYIYIYIYVYEHHCSPSHQSVVVIYIIRYITSGGGLGRDWLVTADLYLIGIVWFTHRCLFVSI